jgi:hypothetical protein
VRDYLVLLGRFLLQIAKMPQRPVVDPIPRSEEDGVLLGSIPNDPV